MIAAVHDNGNTPRFGMLTIHDALNFGSLLQAISLWQAVSQLGANVEIIDYRCEEIASRECTYALDECRLPHDYAKHYLGHRALEGRKHYFHSLLRSYARVSEREYTSQTIGEANSVYDAFIAGSDMIWDPAITGRDLAFFLDFAETGKKRLAYSASIGVTDALDGDERVLQLLKGFHALSVREEDGARWASHVIGRGVPATCDPTMLWDSSSWAGIAKSPNALGGVCANLRPLTGRWVRRRCRKICPT